MRFSTACVAALSAGVASAGSWFGGSQDVITKDVEKVPGDSPLEFCDSDHSNDIVKIESVDLLPNPPESYVCVSQSNKLVSAGQILTVF